jgi:TolB protein
MLRFLPFAAVSAALVLAGCAGEGTTATDTAEAPPATDSLHHPGESRLGRITQLTFGGENAEAYWAVAEDALVLQKTDRAGGIPCDRIFWSPLDKADPRPLTLNPVSDGTGRTTCAYFLENDTRVVYASTRHGGADCPPEPDRGMGYVWPLYDTYELYVADRDGGNRVRLTDNAYYDAEATVSPDGSRIVFTSTRDGDIELYTCAIDGSDVRRVTHEPGYDGGAFFSPDGERLIFRASRFKTDSALAEYRALLARGLVKPTEMELFTCKVDGSDLRQITDLGGANWAPYLHPDGERVLFSSNHHTGGFPFNLFLIRLDGTGLEQVTFDEAFDSFPMFTRDGKHLVFSSNRNNGGTRDTNVFLAEWLD